jgi:hypothetical protein
MTLGSIVAMATSVIVLNRPYSFVPLIHLFSATATTAAEAAGTPNRAWFGGGLLASSVVCAVNAGLALRMVSPFAVAVSLFSALNNLFWFAGAGGALFAAYCRGQVRLPTAVDGGAPFFGALAACFACVGTLGAGGVAISLSAARRRASPPRAAVSAYFAAATGVVIFCAVLAATLGRWAEAQTDPLAVGTSWLLVAVLVSLKTLILVAALFCRLPERYVRRFRRDQRRRRSTVVALAIANNLPVPPEEKPTEEARAFGLDVEDPSLGDDTELGVREVVVDRATMNPIFADISV